MWDSSKDLAEKLENEQVEGGLYITQAPDEESKGSVPSTPLLWIYHMLERARRDLQDAVFISARMNFLHLFRVEIGPIQTLPSSLY